MTKQKKLRVAVLYGGRSAEREVSLNTGKQIIANLDRTRYQVFPVEIAVQGDAWIAQLRAGQPDVAVLALHGPFGEDGTIQGMLEMLRIPYTCSGVLASALAMDKYRLCEFLRGQGVRVPEGVLVNRHGVIGGFARSRATPKSAIKVEVAIQKIIGFPCVVKPNQLGSSVGVTVNIRTEAALRKALDIAFSHDKEALVEEFISGREITAPVVGNEVPKALPLIEIIPKVGTFYDYESKYADGGSDHIIPAKLSPEITETIQGIAMRVHSLIGARGVTRCDFILKESTPYFLEINTIPGMTSTSLVPHSAQTAGFSFSKFLDQLVRLATQS